MYRYLTLVFVLCCMACHTPELAQREAQEASTDPNAALAALGIELPTLEAPVANYVHSVRTGNLIFTAGKGPALADGSRVTGKLGQELSVAEGYAAARLAGIQLLATLQAEVGNLRNIKRIVQVTGMVNASPDFTQHSQVINGCSDLLVAVFGEKGKHARAAVGMGSLPGNMAVEITLVAEVFPTPK